MLLPQVWQRDCLVGAVRLIALALALEALLALVLARMPALSRPALEAAQQLVEALALARLDVHQVPPASTSAPSASASSRAARQ
jgi:hypothetical protein